MDQGASSLNKAGGEPFGLAGWHVDPESLRVSKGKKTINLEPKVMAVLDYLACRPGSVVKRQELEDTVWAGTIVGIDALTNVILKLRKAFGDKARKPRIIETIAKTGYRLIAEVSVEDQPDLQSAADTGPVQRNWWAVVSPIVVSLVLVTSVVFWWQPWAPQREPASLERMAFPLPDIPSIAVLPFINMSDDAQQEYYVDGMTDDLITGLSKVSGLFVIARNSVFSYKGKNIKVRQIAEELGVRYIMEGSVRLRDNQVRINAQLIDASTGGHVWAERYDGALSDIFALQDKVTSEIVTALALNLTGDPASKPTTSSKAYDLFLRGWAHYQRHTAGDSAKAVPYFEAAIRLDSQYAQAHAALSAVYWEIWNNHWTNSLDISLSEAMKNSKNHLQEAMKQPSSLAHWVASNILIAEGSYESAITEAKQIVALDANNADGYLTLANALALAGKPDESANFIKKAVRLNPHSLPLHIAVQKDDINAVKQLIADQVSIGAKDHYGRTPLHIAAEYGHVKVTALLIEADADIEARTYSAIHTYWQYTPLMVTAEWDQASVAKLLISAGADVNARDGSKKKWAVLHIAAAKGNTGVAEILIKNGADIDVLTDRTFNTPLLMAARGGHKTMAELLINQGANINAANSDANTPLHYAAQSGTFEIVQSMLAKGADVNTMTIAGSNPGQTPLHATAYSGNTKVAELLISQGADINAANQYGYTPLRRTVDQGQLAMAELLIKKGADTGTRDKHGVTPLHVVATTRHVEIAELLIAGGADINAKDTNSGFTPLDYAQGGDTKLIEMLKRRGALCTIC